MIELFVALCTIVFLWLIGQFMLPNHSQSTIIPEPWVTTSNAKSKNLQYLEIGMEEE